MSIIKELATSSSKEKFENYWKKTCQKMKYPPNAPKVRQNVLANQPSKKQLKKKLKCSDLSWRASTKTSLNR